jgi:hypothetical protein
LENPQAAPEEEGQRSQIQVGEVQVMDGEYSITFYNKPVEVEPGEP